jgi:hypothetical protein
MAAMKVNEDDSEREKLANELEGYKPLPAQEKKARNGFSHAEEKIRWFTSERERLREHDGELEKRRQARKYGKHLRNITERYLSTSADPSRERGRFNGLESCLVRL